MERKKKTAVLIDPLIIPPHHVTAPHSLLFHFQKIKALFLKLQQSAIVLQLKHLQSIVLTSVSIETCEAHEPQFSAISPCDIYNYHVCVTSRTVAVFVCLITCKNTLIPPDVIKIQGSDCRFYMNID